MERKAYVTGASSREQLDAYLPNNYGISFEGENQGRLVFEIEGEDVAGWTLDGYVIPRLASGLIWAEEIA